MAKELAKKVALLIALGLTSLVQAASQGDHHATLVDKLDAGEYSRRGADICLGCHDETYPFPTNQIFRTLHGQPNSGSPFAVNNNPARFPVGLQCEACHGPAGKHSKQILEDNEHRLPMINFGQHANAGADLQNSMCLSCHDDYRRHNWFGSEHEVADISCTDCHRIHHDQDPVQQQETQVDTCNICHTGVAADIVKRSAHPLRNNQLVCEDCHQVHGNTSEKLMSSATLNDTCYT